MNNFTFLTEDQIFGNAQLDIIKKRGTKAAITDFSILLGGYVSDFYLDGKNSLEDRTAAYWTKTDDGDNDARVVWCNGLSSLDDVDLRELGARPALPFSDLSNISTNGVSRSTIDGVLELNYGYYPQMAVNCNMQNILENAYNIGALYKTENFYVTDSRKYNEYDEIFRPQNHAVYEYEGKKYVRVIANSYFDGFDFKLSNGESYKDCDAVWIEVAPVKWLVDEKEKIIVTEKLIFSGVQFNRERNYKTKNFDKTDIKLFMDQHLSKDLFKVDEPNKIIDNDSLNLNENNRKQNPYNFNFDFVSEEEIIKGAILSDISVFLHGQSSEGKSARVKELDPDLEIIYLRNATPESLNGKSVYNSNTGEMIDIKPTWLKRLEEKCDKEKDKIHIVFFDEITNALLSIQGMAFNIILDKEVNGIWKLPENARIVAAGNDIKDSLAANQMAEPLFNRFAHVYINTTVTSWLQWAITPNEVYEKLDYNKTKIKSKIHPSIYAYITYKSFNGKDVLRTPFTGEKPNADPRKWEMASKVLYETKQPEMLRALIGEALTKDFIEFCKKQVITVEDVIDGNYNDSDLDMDLSSKFATAVGLSSVDDRNLEVVRNFVMRLGAEILATFDNLWAHGDEKRLERIAELRISNSKEGGIKL